MGMLSKDSKKQKGSIIEYKTWAGGILVVVCLLFFSGCGSITLRDSTTSREGKKNPKATETTDVTKAEENTTSNQEQTQEENTQQELEARQQEVLTKDYSNYPKTYNSWWFKRNKDHMPSGAQEEIAIGNYDAHYIDETAMTSPQANKVIYLTFDCGYENGFTNAMLDTLKKHQALACFFVTQTFIRDNVDLVKRMKEEGHLVGNHTVTHPNLCEAPVEKIVKELVDCQNYMKEATGYDMDLFFRPPKGEYSEYLLAVAKDLGYRTVFWSMAYLDYDVNNQPTVDHVIEHWRTYYHPGAIPLIHNVSSANAAALETILTDLEKEGYHFASLQEMVRK